MKIHPFGDDPLSWRKMPQWWIGTDADSSRLEDWQARNLVGCKAHGKGVVAALEGVADRSAAEALDGYYIAAPREALPKPGKDEYYWGDLIGLQVVNLAGIELGSVRGLIETGGHDVLDIVAGDVERLIPFVGKYVQDVDLEKKQIRVEWELDW